MKTLLGVFLLSCALLAQKNETANAKIRREAADHSQVMSTLHVLTDRYGPRLTGSPNFEAASVWHLANRNEMLPRFTKEQMPPPGTGAPAPAPTAATPAKQ